MWDNFLHFFQFQDQSSQQPAKNKILQLFLRNQAPFKFLLQVSSKNICLIGLVWVRSRVADLPSSPVVGSARLQAETDFHFQFGFELTRAEVKLWEIPKHKAQPQYYN